MMKPKESKESRLGPKKYSVLGISRPLSWSWPFSVVGAECCHTYFWIAKDLMWMQGLRDLSILFGISALLWSLIILWHAIRLGNLHELWIFPALFFWLFANYWWMAGEAHDYEFPYEAEIAPEHTATSGRLLWMALFWLLIYYCVVTPFNLLPLSKQASVEYEEGKMPPRFCFKNFRQYENLHMLLWITKDLSWNSENPQLFISVMVPTIAISIDFIYLSTRSQASNRTVDTIHYIVVLVWVIGNSIWAYGDLFVDEYYDPLMLFTNSQDSLLTARWYSSWVLAADLVPIVLLYLVWVYLTVSGRLKRKTRDRVRIRRGVEEDDEDFVSVTLVTGTGSSSSENENGYTTNSMGVGSGSGASDDYSTELTSLI